MSQHTMPAPRFTRVTLDSALGDSSLESTTVPTILIEQDGAEYILTATHDGLHIALTKSVETRGLVVTEYGNHQSVIETNWDAEYAYTGRDQGIEENRLVCADCGKSLTWQDSQLVHPGTKASFSTNPAPHIATPATNTHPPIPTPAV